MSQLTRLWAKLRETYGPFWLLFTVFGMAIVLTAPGWGAFLLGLAASTVGCILNHALGCLRVTITNTQEK